MVKELFVGALTIIFASAFVAQTSDKNGPGRRIECSAELGIAHNHCWVYCEAMDCEANPRKISRKSCRQLKAQWLEMTGQANLPCEPGPGPACAVEDLWLSFVIDGGSRDYQCMCNLDGKIIPWMAQSLEQDCFCRRCWNAGYGRCLAGWSDSGRSVCKCAQRSTTRPGP
jgi:hypothetical protein